MIAVWITIGFLVGCAVYGVLMLFLVSRLAKQNTTKGERYNEETIALMRERNETDREIAGHLREIATALSK
jgi:hypothetical protein